MLTVPEAKIQKVMLMAFEAMWDWGNKRVTRLATQQLRGTGGYVGNVSKGIRPELASFDRILGGEDQSSEFVSPKGDEKTAQSAWESLWMSVEVIRILTHQKDA